QESQDRLRLALEATDAGTFDFYPTTGQFIWSTRCKELFGLPPDAPVTYAIFLSGLHPEDRARVHHIVQRELKPGSNGRFDAEYRTIGFNDGPERWIAAKGLVVFDFTRKAARFIGTVLDITQEKEQQLELQAAKREVDDASRAKD